MTANLYSFRMSAARNDIRRLCHHRPDNCHPVLITWARRHW